MISKILILLILVTLLIPVTNTFAEEIVTPDTAFLNKLNNMAKVEPRIDLVNSFTNKVSEEVRLTLEAIALDTKQNSSVRMQAICSLESSATPESVPILLDILKTDLKQRRGFWACAIPILGNLNDRSAIPLLLHIANMEEAHLAGMDHMAIKALAKLGDKREVSFLSSKAYIWPVRLSVIQGLARIASVQSIDILIEALQEEEEPEVVSAAKQSLL